MNNLVGADETAADTFKLDLDYDTELFDLPTKIEFGGLYTDRTKRSSEYSYLRSFTTGTLTLHDV